MPFDGSSFIRHVAERLIHEFRFSQGAGTPGLIGLAKEHPARVQLERLMPGGVGVGSGIVVDSYGGVSRQQDIVIYEKLSPIFTHNDAAEATYFPVEGVIAVGEVKSSVGRSELHDVVAKSASVKSLRRHAELYTNDFGQTSVCFRQYGSGLTVTGDPSETFDQDRNSLDQIFSFVLCQKFSAKPDTTLSNFTQECRDVGAALAPNMVSSLDDGCFCPIHSASGLKRALMEGDGLMFSADPMGGFSYLLMLLRLYVTSGRTVERRCYERYFRMDRDASSKLHMDHRSML